MQPLNVILATASPLAQTRLSRDLAAVEGVRLCGKATDLSAVYILAEQVEPDIALVGRDLLAHPDFEGIRALFRVIGTTMIEIAAGAQETGGQAPTQDGGICPGLPPDRLLAALRNARAAAPAASQFGGQNGGPAGGIGYGMGAGFGTATGTAIGSGQAAGPANGTAARTGAALARPAGAGPDLGGLARDRIILIGASTGGIDALIQILSALPADCPPTAVVQHTGAAFSDSLIRLFARCAQAQVVAARGTIRMEPGLIVVGAGCGGHLQLTPHPQPGAALRPGGFSGGFSGSSAGGSAGLWAGIMGETTPVSGHMPSVDVLFRSALPVAPRVVAALLTGMGRDGAQGLLDLRRAGARTLAQDQASSVVYGMPRAAAELHAAERIVPLSRIAGEILALCAAPRPELARR